jgi:hypothetical protein
MAGKVVSRAAGSQDLARPRRALPDAAASAGARGRNVRILRRRRGDGGAKAGSAQPTLDALVSPARALHVSLDALLFDDDERGPHDHDLKLILEAVEQFPPDEKATAKTVLQRLVWTGP